MQLVEIALNGRPGRIKGEKMKKKIWLKALMVTLTTFFLMVISASNVFNEDSRNVKVGLQLFKNTYLLQENTWVKTWMENRSNEEQRVNYSWNGRLIVTNSNGKAWKFNLSEYAESIFSIPARSLIYPRTFSLGYYYGSDYNRSTHTNFLPIGSYAVFAEQYYIYPNTLQRVQITSDTFKFSIAEPDSKDQEALKLLISGNFNKILFKYPDSPYVPTAFAALVQQIWVGGALNQATREKSKERIKRLVYDYFKKHANEPGSVPLVDGEIGDSNELLLDIEKRFKGTLVGERASEVLKERRYKQYSFPLKDDSK